MKSIPKDSLNNKTDYNFFNDRRKHLRKPFKAKVMLKLTELISGYGYTKDITLDSMRIRSLELFLFFKPEQAHVFQNAPLKISMPTENLVIEGRIHLVNTGDSELIVLISKTSDPEKWNKISK